MIDSLEPAADVPADEPGDYDDGLFAQYGVFDWTFTGEHEFFELDITRQLAVPAPPPSAAETSALHL